MIIPRSLVVPPALAIVMSCPALLADDSKPAPDRTAPAHPLPSRFREAIAAKLPKYAPKTPSAPAAKPFAREPVDDSDGIVRLPEYKVSAPKMPGTENSYLTPKGRLDLAFKNAPGLRLGNFGNLNQDIALEIMAEEKLAAERADLKDKVLRTTPIRDAASKATLRLMHEAVLQPNTDWASHNAGNDRK